MEQFNIIKSFYKKPQRSICYLPFKLFMIFEPTARQAKRIAGILKFK